MRNAAILLVIYRVVCQRKSAEDACSDVEPRRRSRSPREGVLVRVVTRCPTNEELIGVQKAIGWWRAPDQGQPRYSGSHRHKGVIDLSGMDTVVNSFFARKSRACIGTHPSGSWPEAKTRRGPDNGDPRLTTTQSGYAEAEATTAMMG